jgi:hypothetical protein
MPRRDAQRAHRGEERTLRVPHRTQPIDAEAVPKRDRRLAGKEME